MPASIDLGRSAQVTHSPTLRLDGTLAQLPKFDPMQLIDGWLQLIKDVTGIDLSVLKDFLDSLFGGMLDFTNPSAMDPAAVWQSVVSVFLLPLNMLLGPDSPLNLANAFGLLGEGNVDGLPGVRTISETIRDILGGAPTVPPTQALQDVKDWWSGVNGRTQGLNSSGQLSGSNITGPVADANVPGIGLLQDAIKNGVDNLGGSGWSLSTVLESLQGQRDTITSTAAMVAALQDQVVSEDFSGVTGLDAFEYVNPAALDGSLWDTEYLEGSASTAYLAVADGHNAGMVRVADGVATQMARFKGENHETLTAYQASKVVVAERMVAPAWGGFGSPPAIDVYCRMSADGSKWVRVRIQADGATKFAYRNGGGVVSVSGTNDGARYANPSVGAVLEIRAGSSAGENVFRAVVNGTVVNSWTDTGGVTDATARGGGFGQRWQDDNAPGKIAFYSLTDNAPAPVPANTMRVYRSATAAVTKSSANSDFPSGTFDTVDYLGQGLSWNAATNEVTCEKAGTYLCTLRAQTNTSLGMGAGGAWYPVWSVGGVQRSRGRDGYALSVNGIGVPALSQESHVDGGPFVYAVPAGGAIKVGMGSTANVGVIGDAGGLLTYLTVTKLG